MEEENAELIITPQIKEIFRDDIASLFYDMIIQCKVESEDHLRYVREYTRIFAEAYAKLNKGSRLTRKKRELIAKASVVHDIGMINIPDFLVTKHGRLSPTEMYELRKHTIRGGQIIKATNWNIDREFSRICYNICLYHHEKCDGTGYPYGLKEDKIPIEAQLVGLADIYEVLVHRDSNRTVSDNAKAYELIMSGKCGEFSQRLKECFDSAIEQIESVKLV